MILGGFYFSFQIYMVDLIFSRLAFEVYDGRAQLVPSNNSKAMEKKLPLIERRMAVRVKNADEPLGMIREWVPAIPAQAHGD